MMLTTDYAGEGKNADMLVREKCKYASEDTIYSIKNSAIRVSVKGISFLEISK